MKRWIDDDDDSTTAIIIVLVEVVEEYKGDPVVEERRCDSI